MAVTEYVIVIYLSDDLHRESSFLAITFIFMIDVIFDLSV